MEELCSSKVIKKKGNWTDYRMRQLETKNNKNTQTRKREWVEGMIYQNMVNLLHVPGKELMIQRKMTTTRHGKWASEGVACQKETDWKVKRGTRKWKERPINGQLEVRSQLDHSHSISKQIHHHCFQLTQAITNQNMLFRLLREKKQLTHLNWTKGLCMGQHK